jgi:hypothetical protein
MMGLKLRAMGRGALGDVTSISVVDGVARRMLFDVGCRGVCAVAGGADGGRLQCGFGSRVWVYVSDVADGLSNELLDGADPGQAPRAHHRLALW